MNLITQDELNLLSDTKYKSYIQAIDKCVKNFESSTEWADLISSLGKLKKVILINQSYLNHKFSNIESFRHFNHIQNINIYQNVSQLQNVFHNVYIQNYHQVFI